MVVGICDDDAVTRRVIGRYVREEGAAELVEFASASELLRYCAE